MPHYPTPLLPVEQIPPVALESMNQTHREEVELINRLAALVAAGMVGECDAQSITDQLKALIDHTQQHFARENRLMEQVSFPAYPIHRDEHHRVLNLLEALLHSWLEQQALQPLADFLFDEWPSWFDNHVLTMDSVTAGFIHQHGGYD